MDNRGKNFTTRGQSTRLINVGVPISTCDMYYQFLNGDIPADYPVRPFIKNLPCDCTWYPCWSVGQLISIIQTVAPQDVCFSIEECEGLSCIDILIKKIYALSNRGVDFSKYWEVRDEKEDRTDFNLILF